MVAPSARRRSSITCASLLPSRGAATPPGRSPSSGLARVLRLRLRCLTVLGRVLRSLLDGDGFQTGRRQFERVTLSSVIAAPDRRSRFRLDLAGQTKLREFGADFAESRALDRCRRRQATVLALCRGAHHYKLCVGKFDTHDPTLLSSWRSGRSGPLTRTSPGSASADGAVGSRALAAPSASDTNASFRTKSQCFLHRARNCGEWPNKPLRRILQAQAQRLPLLLGGLQTESLSSEALFG